MSDKLPRASQPRLQRTLYRKQFFAMTDALAQQATVNASGVNGSSVQRAAQTPELLQMEQMQTSASLPAIHSNGNGRQGHRQFQIPSLLQPEQMQTTTQLPAGNGAMQPTFLFPAVETMATQHKSKGVDNSSQTWKPGTFGFENDNGTSSFEKEDTFSMLVLKGISNQQGQATPIMQSEISGAAGSARARDRVRPFASPGGLL